MHHALTQDNSASPPSVLSRICKFWQKGTCPIEIVDSILEQVSSIKNLHGTSSSSSDDQILDSIIEFHIEPSIDHMTLSDFRKHHRVSHRTIYRPHDTLRFQIIIEFHMELLWMEALMDDG